jgi:hypothetical protein
MSIRKHVRRLSRREAAQILVQAYDHQQRAHRGSANNAVWLLTVSLNSDVWEQVVSTLRPLIEEQGLILR